MVYEKILLSIFLILQITGFAGAATLNVGPEQTYKTIQSAVDVAGPGDVVSVSEGTYLENVVVKGNGIMIIGNNKEKTIVDGKKTGSVFRITANNIVISGFTIQDSGGSGKEDGGVSIYTGNNNLIANNIITNDPAGIAIYQSSNNNEVSGNIIMSNGRNGGIFIFSSNDNKIFNNDIKENVFGVYGDSARSNRIYANNFINNKDQAFDNSGMNSWDDGKSGNYWSDYKGSGGFAVLGGKSKDNFPLSASISIKNVEIPGLSAKQQTQEPTQTGTGKSTPGLSFGTVMISLILIYYYNRRHHDN
ncbi:MAG: right-handed parallel beta-helix repeat-containing protein [Candidatus Methanoperedens sp.]|nr:right-handed parallel beta-helix repeat-containing protein [Candidatus Methanoperedens sp.]MCE8426869.1 right-handed parallel beta-helix repeat-containing protein [Candidatus Methanoperedens sp.]